MIARPTPIALTIAGSDSGGGAGIQADLKTFAALGVYGTSALTAVTAQNTRGVSGVHLIPPAMIEAQIEAVLADIAVGAVKTGMLGEAEAVRTVARALAARPQLPLVLDPVMVATSGDPLISEEAVAVLRSELIPRAEIITPNLPEAAKLLAVPPAKDEIEAQQQAVELRRLGCSAVLLKGGHGEGDEAVDYFFDGRQLQRLARPRLATRNTHGTGCTLSAAICAGRARGMELPAAVRMAKTYLWEALAKADEQTIGSGHGPVHHMFVLASPGRVGPPV
jgi:hydroxymethylpyrimidine/phosphomethylpyrimidine kinase